ncbi:hypothetical protein [Hoeflea marina]|uniref:hypothetical protein n=1 Tax=Hoeflea marina TaxID=274592 RepID=UPI0011B6887E|nr:hypothetical protein [Hoeflea marina]
MKQEYKYRISSDIDYDELICELYIENEPCLIIFLEKNKQRILFLDGIKAKNVVMEELVENIRSASDALMRHIK